MNPKIRNVVFQLNVIKLLIKQTDNERIQRGIDIFQTVEMDLRRLTDSHAVDYLNTCLSSDLKKAAKQIRW